MIAVSFALPEESKEVTAMLDGAERKGKDRLGTVAGRFAGREVRVVHTGMGMASATERVEFFLRSHAPAAWIAAGFGGALDPELEIGEVVVCHNYSSPALMQAIDALPARRGALVTAREVVETAAAKAQLARHTNAVVVDMETSAIHRLCSTRGIPMLAIRCISDTARRDLPVPARVWFDADRQVARPGPLAGYLLRHPGRVAGFARFVRGIGLARRELTGFLLSAVAAIPERGPEK